MKLGTTKSLKEISLKYNISPDTITDYNNFDSFEEYQDSRPKKNPNNKISEDLYNTIVGFFYDISESYYLYTKSDYFIAGFTNIKQLHDYSIQQNPFYEISYKTFYNLYTRDLKQYFEILKADRMCCSECFKYQKNSKNPSYSKFFILIWMKHSDVEIFIMI